MAEWKKVLVSGSNIEVAAITASIVATLNDSDDIVLVITSDGGVKQVTQATIQGTTVADFTLEDSAGTTQTFDATGDTLLITGSGGTSTTVTDSGTTTTVTVNLPSGTISSSAQIDLTATDGYTSFSSSLSADITTNAANIATAQSDVNTINTLLTDLAATASIMANASAALASDVVTNTDNIADIEGSVSDYI